MSDPILSSAFIIDTHADTPQRFTDEGWDFTAPLHGGMLNLETARAGNVAAEFFAIWAEPQQWKGRYAHRTLALIDGVLEQVRKHSGKIELCCSADEILAAHEQGKFAALMGIEGGHSIENNLGLLRNYYRLGVRYMTLTWSNTNEWADASGDLNDPSVHHHNGLTPFGKEVVREMNRLGMMVDVSHVSDKTFWDTLDVSRAPVIASHSSARFLTQAPRNLTDEMLRALASKDGVAMVNFFPAFIDENWRAAWNAQRPERREAHEKSATPYIARGEAVPFAVSDKIDREFAAKIGRAPFDSLIDHFDHMIQVAGIDHVGIGTDFDGMPVLPEGIDSAADLPKVAATLMARGYTADDMKKVQHGNLLRVFHAVQDVSGNLND